MKLTADGPRSAGKHGSGITVDWESGCRRGQHTPSAGTLAPGKFGEAFEAVFSQRMKEADEFLCLAHSPKSLCGRAHGDAPGLCRNVVVQAVLSLRRGAWLEGDPAGPAPPAGRWKGAKQGLDAPLQRRRTCPCRTSGSIPWYAAWDLAFHCIPLAMVDSDFAKEQLILLLREWYMHPNGQLPAYEWAFGDVNPPVHAWAAWRVYKIDRRMRGVADREVSGASVSQAAA